MSFTDVSSLTLSKQIAAFLILARYYALSRFAFLLSTRVDTEGYAVEGDRKGIFDNLQDLISQTAKEAAAYGYVVMATGTSQVGIANDDVDQVDNPSPWERGVWDTAYLGTVPSTLDEGIL